jgi:hypothetical protein
VRLKLENRLGIQAPVEVVWAIMHDIAAWHEWNPLYPEAKGVIGFGEKLTLTEAMPGAPRRTLLATVVDWAPNEAIHWRRSLTGGLVTSIHYLELEKMHDEGCIFSNGELYEGFFGPMFSRRKRRQIRDGFATLSEALRDRAEARWREATRETT